MMLRSHHIVCYDLEAWETAQNNHPELRDPLYISALAENICRVGFVDPLRGVVASDAFELCNSNFREGFTAFGCASRHRALLLHMIDYTYGYGHASTVYINEHTSGFARTLAADFRYLVRSEYIADQQLRRTVGDVRHEDPLSLTLPDHSFDLYVAPDNIIYAASMGDFLKEARRVLRQSGLLLATFPFRYGEQSSEVRAELRDGELIHHLEPRFDPAPVGGERLVFFTPGWDILKIARDAGFSSASIVAHSSQLHAVLGTEIAVVFVLRAEV